MPGSLKSASPDVAAARKSAAGSATPEASAGARKSTLGATTDSGEGVGDAHDASYTSNEMNISTGSAAMDAPPPLHPILTPAIRTSYMSGWLDRRTGSGLGKRWKKRFFVIEPHAFVEYRDSHGGATKLFSLREIADILAEDRERFTFGFRFGPARWISLRASSAAELDDWVSALRKAVIELGPPTPTLGVYGGRRKNSPTATAPGSQAVSAAPIASPTAATMIQNTTTANPLAEQGDLMQRRGKEIPRLTVTEGSTSRPRGNSEHAPTATADRRNAEFLGSSSVSSVSPTHLRRSMDAVVPSSRTQHADSLQDGTSEEDGEEEEGHSSSDTDEEDFDFRKHGASASAPPAANNGDDQTSSTLSGKPRSTWGTSLRAFFSSRRATSESLENEEDEESDDESKVKLGSGVSLSFPSAKKVFDIRTVQVVEYDVVEIFENQRWFPITNWGTKMLPHDRALWTNRTGHSRTDWYRTSLDPNDTIAVNTATLGAEDREEIPGGQVHVIKDPWQWEGSWRLAPLLALNSPHHAHTQPQIQQQTSKDPFREGLKRDLRTGSLDSLTEPEDAAAPAQPSQQQQPPPTPSSLPNTATGVTATTPHHSSSVAPVQQPQSAKHSSSVVKSLKRRFISKGSSESAAAPVVSASGQLPFNSSMSVQSAPAALAHHPSSMSEVAAAVPVVVMPFDHDGRTGNHGSGEGWAQGFDFPDFDSSLARGVPKTHPPFASSNVRTRRWIRTRRRVINVTGRFPDNILPFITSVLSFQRQVVAEGWLGVKGRAGHWRSRYYKLVRICSGIWDGGIGEGLVESTPASYVLIACECKELHQNANKSLRLESQSSARIFPMALGYQPPPGNASPSEEDSLVMDANRFAPFDHGDLLDDLSPHPLASRLRVESVSSLAGSVNSAADEPPRSGRFELMLNKDHVFLMNADSRADALAWVSALNRAASELQKATEEINHSANALVPPTTPNSQNNHNKQHRKSLLRFPHLKKRPLKGVAEGDEADEEVDAEKEEQEEHLHLEDTGEDPVANEHPLPAVFPPEADSKLKEVIKIQLGVGLRTFFQTFVGDKARYSIKDFHVEQGDTEVKCSSWHEAPPGGRSDTNKDDFDLEGWETVPERLLTFRTLTGAPIGPKVTRVEKRQRYYYYSAAKVLVVKTWAKSLDVPFGDSFLVVEKWIVTADKDDDHKVNVRVIFGSHFLKSVMLRGTIQSSIENGAGKVYPIWKKKFFLYGGAKKAQAESPAAAAGTAAEAEEAKKPEGMVATVMGGITSFGEMAVPVAQTTWKLALIVFFLWWMLEMLWVLQRIAKALEENSTLSKARRLE